MTRTLTLSVLLATALATTACNSYDPNLGDAPFRCGTSSPECPDGYTCVEFTLSERICQADEDAPRPDGGNNGDGGGFTCLDDSELEPNNAINQATITPIPELADSYSLVGLALCPDTDIDIFRFNIDISGKNVRADITYNSAQGELLLDILNSTGTSIRSGTPVSGNADVVRAEVPNMPSGQYFVQVRAPAGVQNNYNIEIVTTGP